MRAPSLTWGQWVSAAVIVAFYASLAMFDASTVWIGVRVAIAFALLCGAIIGVYAVTIALIGEMERLRTAIAYAWSRVPMGTRSVLIGAHCFFLHPWFVARAWHKLYGFPWQPWLWLAFFVHDIGYLGKPNMDGPEGEQHPLVGAKIMFKAQRLWRFLVEDRGPWYKLRDRWSMAHVYCLAIWNWPLPDLGEYSWAAEVQYHSRYLAGKDGVQPSRLCLADKYAIVLTPAWLYLPLVALTGEVEEYMAKAHDRVAAGEHTRDRVNAEAYTSNDPHEWYRALQYAMRRWVLDQKVNLDAGRSVDWRVQ